MRYAYLPFGLIDMIDYTEGYDSLRAALEANPYYYRGYYRDRETGYYFLQSRYYDAEIGRFIQSGDVSNSNFSSINGQNLYAYANNNSINKTSNYASETTIAKAIIILTAGNSNSSAGSNIIPFAANKSQSGVHWENKWLDTGLPDVFVFSKEGLKLIDWGLSVYKGSLYLDHNENHSIYVAAGNVNTSVGIDPQKCIGIDLSASVVEIGYDGRILDASIEGLTLGITAAYKKGKIEFGIGLGWFGFSISVDFIELFQLEVE